MGTGDNVAGTSALNTVAKAALTPAGGTGLTIGALGLGASIYTVLTGTFDNDESLKNTFLLGPVPMATGAGLGFMLLAQQGGLAGTNVQKWIQGGAIALITAGVVGGILGLVPSLFPGANSKPVKTERQAVPLLQGTPATVAEMSGIKLGDAYVQNKDQTREQYGVYIDATTAAQLTATDVSSALGEANQSVKDDESNRSQAILKLSDNTFWRAQLVGDVDQIDGRFYTDDNEFDLNRTPIIDPVHPSLLGITGVQTIYNFDTTPKMSAAPAAGAAAQTYVGTALAPVSTAAAAASGAAAASAPAKDAKAGAEEAKETSKEKKADS